MATDNGNTPNVPTSVENIPVIKYGKGQKIVFGNVAELIPHPSNFRHRKDTEFYGIKNIADTLDIPGMWQQLVDGGGIREPIWVSLREDGSKITIRGNRRTITGQLILKDTTTPAALRTALETQTPMIILKGLTAEEEHELIQDQTQKPFLRSEVIRGVFQLRGDKWSFDRIANLMWEALGRFTGSVKKIAEIRSLTDQSAKKEKIKSWLRGSLDCYMIWAFDMGPFLQKCVLLSVMKTDGLAVPEEPYFNTEKNSQKRIAELKKAKEADGSKFDKNLPLEVEGSEFRKVLEKFHAEDYNGGGTPKPQGPKMMSRQDIDGMKDSFNSKLAKNLILRILGQEVPTLNATDDYAAACETKEMLVEKYLPRLNPNVAAIVRVCLVNPDPTDFLNFLTENCVAEEVPPTA